MLTRDKVSGFLSTVNHNRDSVRSVRAVFGSGHVIRQLPRGLIARARSSRAVGHFVSAARITDSDLSMVYARLWIPALSTRPDFPLPAGRGGQVSKYKSTTR